MHIIQILCENLVAIKNKNNAVIIKIFGLFIEVLAFSKNKIFRQQIKKDIFDQMIQLKLKNKFKVLDIAKLEEFIFNTAKMAEVDNINRNVLYSIVEELK